jgi:hypothetical protein
VRARLLAALAQTYSIAAAYEQAYEMLREGLNIASQLYDSKLMAGLFGARAVVNLHSFRLKEGCGRWPLQRASGRIGSSSMAARSSAANIASNATISGTPERSTKNCGRA